MIIMGTKTYSFSYGSIIKKVLSKIISLIYNLFVGVLVLVILAFIISQINFNLKDLFSENVLGIIKKLEIYCGVIIFSIFIIPSFLPQKAEIREDVVKVYRHCLFLSIFMIFRGFNDTILIRQIEEVYRPVKKDKFFEPIPVNVIDWDNMVIIKMNNSLGTEYYIPVQNSEDFIKEVNKRRCDYTKNSNTEHKGHGSL